jgi:hypothetical protein
MPHTEIKKDAERGRETDFVDKLIHGSIVNHCNSDGLGSLHATVQSSYLKILKV